jgi:hypothetical protein
VRFVQFVTYEVEADDLESALEEWANNGPELPDDCKVQAVEFSQMMESDE